MLSVNVPEKRSSALRSVWHREKDFPFDLVCNNNVLDDRFLLLLFGKTKTHPLGDNELINTFKAVC